MGGLVLLYKPRAAEEITFPESTPLGVWVDARGVHILALETLGFVASQGLGHLWARRRGQGEEA